MGTNAESKPYYKKKYLASSTGTGYENIRGDMFRFKKEAQISTFLILMRGRLYHGFPIVVKRWFVNATTIWPFIIIRADSVIPPTLNHEMIHSRQQFEILLVSAVLALSKIFIPYNNILLIPIIFLPQVLYAVEFLIRFAWYRNYKKAYLFNSMEEEAWYNSEDMNYLFNRKWFAWTKNLFKHW